MDVLDIIKNNGRVTPNPNYTKNGKNGPQYYISNNATAPSSYGEAVAPVITPNAFNLNHLGNIKEYTDRGVTPGRFDTYSQLNKALADKQSWIAQLGNSLVQTVGNELLIGTVEGIVNLLDAGIGSVYHAVTDTPNDYSNFIVEGLEKAKEAIREEFPIYQEDPEGTMLSGAMSDSGWWFSNLPSVASSVSLFIPGRGVTSILGKVGKGLRGTTAARNVARVLDKTKYGKTVTDVVRKIGTSGTTANALAETAVTSFTMRTLENYQESAQVYRNMYEDATNYFNDKHFNKNKFIEDNTDENGDFKYSDAVDENGNIDWDRIAQDVASQSASRDFVANYSNIIFDFFQLYALRNFAKGFKSKVGSSTLEIENRAAARNFGRSAAEIADMEKTIGRFDKAKTWTKGTLTPFLAEASEGVEEGINYISEKEGMHLGNVLLGKEVDNSFDQRLQQYLRDGELWDSAFWGVLGGVVFQAAGSGLNKAYNSIMKIEDLDTKDRKLEIISRNERLQDLQRRSSLIDQGYNIYSPKNVKGNISETNPDVLYEKFSTEDGDIEKQKSQAKARLIDDIMTDVIIKAAAAGNLGYLRDYLNDANIAKQMADSGLLEGQPDADWNAMVNAKIDNIEGRIDGVITYLDKLGVNAHYAQIIAVDNVRKQLFSEQMGKTAREIEKEVDDYLNQDFVNFDRKDYEVYRAGIFHQTILSHIRDLQEQRRKLEQLGTLSAKIGIRNIDAQIEDAKKLASDEYRTYIDYQSNVDPTTGPNDEAIKIRDKWIEEHGDPTLTKEENERALAPKFLDAVRVNSYSNLMSQDANLAMLINQLANVEISKALADSEVKLDDAKVKSIVAEYDSMFDRAKIETQKKSNLVLKQMMMKYSEDQVLAHIQKATNDIDGITDEDSKLLDDAIKALDLLNIDNEYYIDAIFDLHREIKGLKAANPNPVPSTGGTQQNNVAQGSNGTQVAPGTPAPASTTAPAPETPFDDESVNNGTSVTPVEENNTGVSPLPAPVQPTSTVAPTANVATNPVMANPATWAQIYFESQLRQHRLSSSTNPTDAELDNMMVEVAAKLRGNGLETAVARAYAKDARILISNRLNVPNALNSELSEVLITSRDAANNPAAYRKAVMQVVDQYMADNNLSTYTGGRRYISFVGLLRYLQHNNTDLDIVKEVYERLRDFLVEEHNDPSKRMVVLMDRVSELYNPNLFNITRLTKAEADQIELDNALSQRVGLGEVIQKIGKDKFNKAYAQLKKGDKIDWKVVDGTIMLYAPDGTEIGKLGRPIVDKRGTYIQVNDGWLSDIHPNTNGSIDSDFISALCKYLSDPNSDFVRVFREWLVGDREHFTPTAQAVINHKDFARLTKFIDYKMLEDDGSISKDNYLTLLNGLAKLYVYNGGSTNQQDYIDSYKLWAQKLKATYFTVTSFLDSNSTSKQITIDYMTQGKLIVVPETNVGLISERIADKKAAKLATLNSITEGNKIFINGSPVPDIGSLAERINGERSFIALDNGSGEISYVQCHARACSECTDQNSTAGKLTKALKNEFFSKLRQFAFSGTQQDFDTLAKFVEDVFPHERNRESLLACLNGNTNYCKSSANVISLNLGNGVWIRISNQTKNGKKFFVIDDNGSSRFFVINDANKQNQYSGKQNMIYMINEMFNNYGYYVNHNYNRRDGSKNYKSGIVTFKDGKFKINSMFFNEEFDSYNDFIIDNDMVNVRTEIRNGSNFEIAAPSVNASGIAIETTRSLRVKLTTGTAQANVNVPTQNNVIQRVKDILNNPRIKDKSVSLIRELMDTHMSKLTINNIINLPIFGKKVIFVDEYLGTNGHRIYGQTAIQDDVRNGVSIKEGDILIGKEFMELIESGNTTEAMMTIIHENLHGALRDPSNRTVLRKLGRVFDEFMDVLEDTNELKKLAAKMNLSEQTVVDFAKSVHDAITAPGENDLMLEEFLVYSLTNRSVQKMLNNIEAQVDKTSGPLNLFQTILRYIKELFGLDINEGSLLEKEYYALADAFDDGGYTLKNRSQTTQTSSTGATSATSGNKHNASRRRPNAVNSELNEIVAKIETPIHSIEGYRQSFNPLVQDAIGKLIKSGTLKFKCKP